ncbi:hypothetical protein RFI_11699 [Reticulomyxa filosa]|uniref:Viral A-type inclusion protein n=1 Tax=Reticulomyxa filosa TaxID=46433 RepID=X6NGK8_RETFI|nr:hypothetical protein RFI_11699 [Reticulomyxa filosa]|eukprot:ETO25440.1 hypothetical protein RFI_11699 [Reticulomyxa filosa]
MSVTFLDDERSDEEESVSGLSTHTIDVEQLNLNGDELVTPPLPDEEQGATDDMYHLIQKRNSEDDPTNREKKPSVGNYCNGLDESHLVNSILFFYFILFFFLINMEAKWRKQERENEDLKIQLEEMSGKYDTRKFFLFRPPLKKKKKIGVCRFCYNDINNNNNNNNNIKKCGQTQQLAFEKERNMVMTEVSETKDQLNNSLAEIKQLKMENSQMKETINRNADRYNDLVNMLTASKNELQQKIAELCRQNEDLEMTLVMIRNSWNQTVNVIESEASKNTNKIERLANEAKSCQLQYETLTSELETKEKMIENLQQRQLQMDMQVSNLELKCAAQSVENAHVKTQFNFMQSKLASVRQWILQLLQQGIIRIDTQRFPITEDNIFDIVVQHSVANTLSFKSGPHYKDNRLTLDP